MVGGLVPLIIARNPEARVGIACDGIVEGVFGGERVSAIFGRRGILRPARLAIVLVDRALTIRRFSPQAEKQFNLLATDVGRPLGHIRHNLLSADVAGSPLDLEGLSAEVIASMREQEREVLDKDGRWHAVRVLPYLTLDNKVDGAVLVALDIDAIKSSERVRIVVELKDRIGAAGAWEASSAQRALSPEDQKINDAVLALMALGFRQIEAHDAVRAALNALGPKATVEDLVRGCLKRGT